MIDKYKEGDEYDWEKIRGNIKGGIVRGTPFQKVKQFVMPMSYKSNGKIVKCQIKGCYEVSVWIINYNEKGVLLCFGHGEDA